MRNTNGSCYGWCHLKTIYKAYLEQGSCAFPGQYWETGLTKPLLHCGHGTSKRLYFPNLFLFVNKRYVVNCEFKDRGFKVAPAVTQTVRVTHKCYVRKESEKIKKGKTKKNRTKNAHLIERKIFFSFAFQFPFCVSVLPP